MRQPASTYRIQCRAGVGLADVTASLDYLQALGISDVYLSPIAVARQGSTHGYDVCDPNALDPEIGSPADLEGLSAALHTRGMGLLLDIVPNHLATDEERNPWWRDVLKHGQKSEFARFFDIDWNPPNPALAGKVLLPILDRPYGDALDASEITLSQHGGQYVVMYGGRRFPISGAERNDLHFIASEPTSRRLHGLLERQHYRLAHWRTAMDELNYRRFFNIEHLAGVRIEDPVVFEGTHRWLGDLVRRGVVTGIRVDHPDGLASPSAYLWRLQRLGGRSEAEPLFVVVEKVLVGDEQLPADWPVQGTTGYEFLNTLNNLFVARHELARLSRGYAKFVGRQSSFAQTEYDARKQVMATTFVSEGDRLVGMLRRLASRDRSHRDLGVLVLRRALIELTANLPVYRTYVDRRGCRATDLVVLSRALARIAGRQSAGVDERALRFIVGVITAPESGKDALTFATRWQQFSSAVFAKSVEDRAFYRDNTLLSLNEVGSDRRRPGADIAAFHTANQIRAASNPYGLLATTTHDTKLSEDVRARLHVLTECSRAWLDHVEDWRRLNNRCRKRIAGGLAPDRDDEYRFYQLLVGLWPADATTAPDSIGARLTASLVKAAREAARRTSWTSPNSEYEAALTTFAEGALANETFVSSIAKFARGVAKAGLLNSLSQTVLKIGSPGVPDFYQGTELCSLRLADPDNRQLVDTAYRSRMLVDLLQTLERGGDAGRLAVVEQLLTRWEDSAVKLFVTAEALRLRSAEPDLFTSGEYLPLVVSQPAGRYAPQLVAFARSHQGRTVIVAAPRFGAATTMGGEWPLGDAVWNEATIRLPESIDATAFRNVFTGEHIAASDGHIYARDLLAHTPVAVATAV